MKGRKGRKNVKIVPVLGENPETKGLGNHPKQQ